MNKLFELIIFSLLLSAQLSSQSISRLKAKKEREKKKWKLYLGRHADAGQQLRRFQLAAVIGPGTTETIDEKTPIT